MDGHNSLIHLMQIIMAPDVSRTPARPPLRWPDVPSISVGVRRTRLFGKGRYARAGNRASIVNNGPGTYPPASVFDNRSPSLKQQGRLYPARPSQGRAMVKHGKNVVR